jgi:hypothetical protein
MLKVKYVRPLVDTQVRRTTTRQGNCVVFGVEWYIPLGRARSLSFASSLGTFVATTERIPIMGDMNIMKVVCVHIV